MRARAQKKLLEKELAEARRREAELRAELGRPAPAPDGKASPDFLFPMACARSGTTAFVDLLNRDPRIALGVERFKYLGPDGRRRHHFRPGYFANPTPDETNIRRPEHYRKLARKLRSGEVRFVGDKVPITGRAFEGLLEEFPGCKIVFLLREIEGVASSFNARAVDPEDRNWPADTDYRKAVVFWNRSLRNMRSLVEEHAADDQVFMLIYEEFFSGDRRWLESLYTFLGMELTPKMDSAFADATKDWDSHRSKPLLLDDEARAFLSAKRNTEDAQWVHERAAAQLGASRTS